MVIGRYGQRLVKQRDGSFVIGWRPETISPRRIGCGEVAQHAGRARFTAKGVLQLGNRAGQISFQDRGTPCGWTLRRDMGQIHDPWAYWTSALEVLTVGKSIQAKFHGPILGILLSDFPVDPATLPPRVVPERSGQCNDRGCRQLANGEYPPAASAGTEPCLACGIGRRKRFNELLLPHLQRSGESHRHVELPGAVIARCAVLNQFRLALHGDFAVREALPFLPGRTRRSSAGLPGT